MRHLRSLIRAASLALFGVLLLVSPSFAQAPAGAPAPFAPAPVSRPGLCAPWHKCVAEALLGVIALYTLMTVGMFLLHRRGFGGVEHKQGSPSGVPVNK